jgi:rhodanese-related sulfurtransferase
MIEDISPQEFLKRRAAGDPMTLLDVREDWETRLALDPNQDTVVICRSGGRSLQVAHFLAAQGFTSVFNLAGGILAWSRDVDPQIPQY